MKRPSLIGKDGVYTLSAGARPRGSFTNAGYSGSRPSSTKRTGQRGHPASALAGSGTVSRRLGAPMDVVQCERDSTSVSFWRARSTVGCRVVPRRRHARRRPTQSAFAMFCHGLLTMPTLRARRFPQGPSDRQVESSDSRGFGQPFAESRSQSVQSGRPRRFATSHINSAQSSTASATISALFSFSPEPVDTRSVHSP